MFKLPATLKTHFISTTEDIQLLSKGLENSDMIGVDSEWKPTFVKSQEERMAILQLSNLTEAFIVDLISLKDNKDLDKALTTIFTS
jgi:ribonuclease D